MKSDYEKHVATFLLYPSRRDVWRNGAKDIREVITNLCTTISSFEEVYLGTDRQIDNPPSGTKIVKMEYNDIWARDSGLIPMESGAVAFNFNAWGGADGLYDDWSKDSTVCTQMSKILNLSYAQSNLTLEGGNLTTDGKGTLIAIEDTIVNDNRNFGLSKEEIENTLKKCLQLKKIIWIPHGLKYDETGGHIDNLCAFVDDGVVFLAWTDDENNEQYPIVKAAFEILSKETDALGRKLAIVKVPLPEIFLRSKDDCVGLDISESSKNRLEGEPIQASFINFIFVNGGVILPQFGDKQDGAVVNIFKEFFKDRKVVPFPAREVVLGGGGLHCITKNI
jgi:agmatine deiminase